MVLRTNSAVAVCVLKPQLPADKTFFISVWYPPGHAAGALNNHSNLVPFVLDALPKSSKTGDAFRYILAGYICLEKDGGGGQWVSPMSTQLTILTEKHNSEKPVFSSSLLLSNTSSSVSKLMCSLVHHTFCFQTPLALRLYSKNYYGWMVKFFIIIILHFTFSLRRSLSSVCLLEEKGLFFLHQLPWNYRPSKHYCHQEKGCYSLWSH